MELDFTKKYWFKVQPLRSIVVEVVKVKENGDLVVKDVEHDNLLYIAKLSELCEIISSENSY